MSKFPTSPPIFDSSYKENQKEKKPSCLMSQQKRGQTQRFNLKKKNHTIFKADCKHQRLPTHNHHYPAPKMRDAHIERREDKNLKHTKIVGCVGQ